MMAPQKTVSWLEMNSAHDQVERLVFPLEIDDDEDLGKVKECES